MLLFLPLFFFVGLYHRFILLFLCRRQGRAGPDEIVALILEPLRRTVNFLNSVTEVLQVTHRVSLFCSPCHSSYSALHSGHGRFWSCASHHGASSGGSISWSGMDTDHLLSKQSFF